MEEIWLTAKGFSKYEVSDQGRIRNAKTGRVLKPCIDKRSGCPRVCLRTDNGTTAARSIHSIVANTFYDYDHDNLIATYLDGDRTNNRADNVELINRSELYKRLYREEGYSNQHARRAVRCRETGEEFKSITEASEVMGIGIQAISRCVNNPALSTRDGFSFEPLD